MKNILLITSLYPSNDVKFLNNTSVCHYFAREWVKMGYNVRVIHSYRIYPWYYYPILKMASKYLAKTQATAILDKKLDNIYSYELDGVHVERIPIKKSRPHGKFRMDDIKLHCKEINDFLMSENFVPDVILGHFLTPSLYLVTELNKYYPKAQTVVSMHGKSTDNTNNGEYEELFAKLDYMGYRSHSIRKSYEAKYGERPYLMCPSGVPNTYIINEPKSFSDGIKNFIYVGSFMDRKHPVTVVRALAKTFGSKDYTITFVGEGVGKKDIIKAAKKYRCLERIRFTGHIPRVEVTKEMDMADVFIMVSENETFGLVYLEAMARGCIVIASKDEGMDGYIIDGVNGFLCNAGDSDNLSEIISKIRSMPLDSLNNISNQSLHTAKRMTDYNVAKEYIQVFK